jgi:hypothetical protein
MHTDSSSALTCQDSSSAVTRAHLVLRQPGGQQAGQNVGRGPPELPHFDLGVHLVDDHPLPIHQHQALGEEYPVSAQCLLQLQPAPREILKGCDAVQAGSTQERPSCAVIR